MTGVVLLMMLLHLVPQLFVMLPYYRITRSFTFEQLLRLLVPFNLLVAYMYLAYYQAACSDAGGVPFDWSPDAAMAEYGVELTAEHRRFCHKCDAFKPPRAHHCRQCKRCVLRMDHHCPWIGNCVGNHNQAHFMRLLMAVSVAGGYLLAMICLRVGDWWNTDWYLAPPSNTETVLIVLTFILGTPPVALTSLLMWYQWYLLAINTTTIETHEQDRVTRLIRRGQIPFFEFPFDVGVWRNLTDVFGPNVLTWLWPFAPPVHDGLLFPVRQPYPEAQFLWPPRDPRTSRRRHPLPDSAFTYGDEQLNPALQPTHTPGSAADLARRAQDSLNGPPGDEDDEEDTGPPLPPSRVRIRRGSEGFEIRPPQYSRMYLELHGSDPHAYAPDAHAAGAPADAPAPDEPHTPDAPGPKVVDIHAEDDEIPLGHLVRRHFAGQSRDLE